MTEKITAKAVAEAFEKVEATSLCALGRIINSQPEDIRLVLEDKIAHAEIYANATIANVLKNLGLGNVGKDTVRQHRRRECVCVTRMGR